MWDYLNDKDNLNQSFVMNDKGADISEVCTTINELVKNWLDSSSKE